MKEHREMLNYYYQICHVHANRIQKALDEINLPLTVEKITAMTIHELGMTELLTGRFSKLQDILGEKIFPLILINLGEDINNKSFIDRLYRLEKLGYIDKAEEWFIYRRACNAASHEYPEAPELMVKNLEEIIHLAKNLLDYWSVLDQKIIQILNL